MADAPAGRPAKVPAIPTLTASNLPQVIESIARWIQTREGRLGDGMDKAVTFRDVGLLNLADSAALRKVSGGERSPTYPSTGSSGPSVAPDVVPPAPTQLTATSALQHVILTWLMEPFPALDHFEVWRSPTTSLAEAALVQITTATVTSDEPPSSSNFYYWVRAVSIYSGTGPGPYNSSTGTLAKLGMVGNADLGPLIVEAANLANGTVDYTKMDTRLLDIKNAMGDTVFGPDGLVGSAAYLNVLGNNVLLTDVAANALVPALNYVGEFATPPTAGVLGANWKQNSVYKNSADGRSYVLTGAPLGWVVYLADGNAFTLTIESSNGTVFRPGQSQATVLSGRLFKNGAEVTTETPASWFRWRRSSVTAQPAPNDDATWNATYATNYKQVLVNVDDVYARATFFCDIVSP